MSVKIQTQSVTGLQDRVNDIVWLDTRKIENVTSHDNDKVVVYFGGDVQDLEVNMSKHRDNKNYSHWSLEKTAMLLSKAFPETFIALVRPSRMEKGTFSCYDNFVRSNSVGSPEHSTDHGALIHLSQLLVNLGLNPNTWSLTLVGFSKGVVVLNQLIRELRVTQEDPRIINIIWLDGGHNGGKDIWPTDRQLLQSFMERNIRIHVRVTPYQVQNSNRPWIGKEEKLFTSYLSRAGAKIERKLYFNEEPASIENHFRIIETLEYDRILF